VSSTFLDIYRIIADGAIFFFRSQSILLRLLIPPKHNLYHWNAMALSDSFSAQWITPALGATFDFNGMLNTTIEFNASSTRTISDLSVVLCQLDDASATPSYVFVADVVGM